MTFFFPPNLEIPMNETFGYEMYSEDSPKYKTIDAKERERE